ncbi:hypothetical protein [Mucilaginibacter sp.]|uniref:MoaF-related domain-containing protein n=1 Tax=Mucilaginibacter sp. TaxID=1882438 RepID=UPI002623E72C|nr:hypothetical protein [Mucilaginibacter sp.]MDB4919379.1 hypothetical protein [Mucilaginibacter sp.]
MDIIGNKYLIDFGMAKAILETESETRLTFTITEKDGKQMNETETVKIKLTEIRPAIWMLNWKEKNGNTITQIQDHEKGAVYMNWTHPDGEFINTVATIRPV